MKKTTFVVLVTITLIVTRAAPLGAVSFSEQLKEKGLFSYWLKLLHYEKSFFGNYSSLVDGAGFFFHAEGKSDPEGELQASVVALSDPDPNLRIGFSKKAPQCVFPERYRFLKSAGLINEDVKDIDCKDFAVWKKGIGAKSITLVFSSSFPNSPASMFGHTFIRFNQLSKTDQERRQASSTGQASKKNDLLDYAASYAADTSADDGTVMYALKGLFGGYKGFFGFSPYYMKVNEYSDSESRDIYEYELNISNEGVDRIVGHLWELYSSTWFAYYFLDENCSYILAKILELGNSDWDLTSSNRFYYLPNDTIKFLTRYSNAFNGVGYRPSLEKKLEFRLSKLDRAELKQFHKVRSGDIAPTQVDNIKVLDTLISFMNYTKHEKENKLSERENALFRNVLVRRAKIEKKSIPIKAADFSKNKAQGLPELSHDPQRITVSSGVANSDFVSGIEYKVGFHDLLAYDAGMEPFSQIEGPDVVLSYDWNEGLASIERVGVINVTSLHPVTFYNPEFSWKGRVNYETIKDFKCHDCHKLDMEGGAGGSIAFGDSSSLGFNGIMYAMVGVYGEISKHFNKSYRIGPTVEWSVLFNYKKYKIRLLEVFSLNVLDTIKQGYFLESELSQSYALSRNWEVRLVNSFVSQYGGFKTQYDSHILKFGLYF